MPICNNCNTEFSNKHSNNGKLYNLTGRKFCLKCSPLNSRNTRSYIVELKENEAFCARCKTVKEKGCFYIRKESGRPFSYCITCQEEVKKLKFEEKLLLISQDRGGACQDCKAIYPIAVYEFYSDENGVYNLSKVKNMSLDRFKTEVERHRMLCRNCSALRQWEKES